MQLLIIPFADDKGKKYYGIASEKEKYISGAADFGRQCGTVIPDRKRWKAYTNNIGHLLVFFIVNLLGEGALAGILPQIWPHSAGLGAPLVYQESCKPETTPEEAFSRALKIEKLKATLFSGPEGYN